MKRSFVIILLILSALSLSSQKDPEAIKILDKFSSTASAAPSVSMKFSLVTNDQAEGTTKSVDGSIVFKKDKYRLDLEDNIIWFNGEVLWSYLPSEKEVTINKPDRKDNSFQARPSSVFSIYKKGYKIRLIDEKIDSYLIDLYPEDLNTDYIRLRLKIGKPSSDLKSVEYKYKNGVIVTLSVKEYDLKQKPDDSMFVYPSDQYKGVEVVDMR